ncbi:MAG TPA: response regulator, partial [Myxococcota bacterium]|nr:response regulator [Myxococcota bacterium]
RRAAAQQDPIARSEAKPSEVNRRAAAQQDPIARSERSERSQQLDEPRFDRERLVVVANANPESCKVLADALEGWGLQVLVAHDGVEAILTIQRALPRAIVIDAALPKMFGFQICELVKRNESLHSIGVVLVGAIHKEDRYRRPPSELYGADVYVEPHELPGALQEILRRFELLPVRGTRGAPAPMEPPGAPSPPRQGERPEHPASDREAIARSEPQASEVNRRAAAQQDPIARSEPQASEVNRRAAAQQDPIARSEPATSPPTQGARLEHPPQAPEGRAQRGEAERSSSRPAAAQQPDPLAAERANAERLARIIVSDIVLYNPEKFASALRSSSVVAAMRDELEEGRALFRERIGDAVRGERDYLAEELLRVAESRGPR